MYFTPVILLLLSNAFMTVAWYGHLRFKSSPLWLVILVSWGIAFIEYCLQVPANRMGSERGLSAATLKIIAEVFSITAFGFFSVLYLKEDLKWNHLVAFLFILGAVFFAVFDKIGGAATAVK